jgi:hypothetical protein
MDNTPGAADRAVKQPMPVSNLLFDVTEMGDNSLQKIRN